MNIIIGIVLIMVVDEFVDILNKTLEEANIDIEELSEYSIFVESDVLSGFVDDVQITLDSENKEIILKMLV